MPVKRKRASANGPLAGLLHAGGFPHIARACVALLPAWDRWQYAKTCRGAMSVARAVASLRVPEQAAVHKTSLQDGLPAWMHEYCYNGHLLLAVSAALDKWPACRQQLAVTKPFPPFMYPGSEEVHHVFVDVCTASDSGDGAMRCMLDAGWSPNARDHRKTCLEAVLNELANWQGTKFNTQIHACLRKVHLLLERGAFWWRVHWLDYSPRVLRDLGLAVRPEPGLTSNWERLATYYRVKYLCQNKPDKGFDGMCAAWGWPAELRVDEWQFPGCY